MKLPMTDERLRGLVSGIWIETPYCTQIIFRLHQWLSASRAGVRVSGLLVGESGTGKSELLKTFLKLHPETRTKEGISRPVLFVEVPHHPTAISILEAILNRLDDPHPYAGSRSKKMARLHKLIAEQGVVMTILDDLQHMVDKNQQFVLYDASECLKEIMISSPISIIGSGLEDAAKVIKSNEQLKRRYAAGMHLPRFDWFETESQDIFLGVLQAFRRTLSMFQMPNLASADVGLRMYLSSGGLMDFVAKILQQAVWNALDAKTWKISLDDLADARDLALFDTEPLEVNPLRSEFTMRRNKVDELVKQAKKINQRVVRPIPKRAMRGCLDQIGL